MIPIDIRPESRILIVAPHPDDECIGAGGVLVKYAAQCDVVLLTNGCACNPERSKEENIATRRGEFASEMAVAGVHRHWSLGIDDGTLAEHADCLLDFDLAPYDVIFTANHLDNHADHRAAFECLRHALQVQALSPAVYEYEIATPLASVSDYLDATDVMERKLDLIRFHQSQLASLDYVKLARSLASYRAVKTSACSYVEAYARAEMTEGSGSAELRRITSQMQRYQQMYQVAQQWLDLVARHQTIEEVLRKRKCRRIAVYGYTPFARGLISMLRGSHVKVAYVIDRKGQALEAAAGMPVAAPSQAAQPVDLVIVTALQGDAASKEMLAEKHLRAESLRDVLGHFETD